MKSKTYLVLLLFMFTLRSFAQNVKDSALFAPLLRFSYAPQFPAGDLVKRFGFNNNIGLDFAIKTKSNWLLGISGNFLFSSNVKETSMLDSFATNAGFIIDQNGSPADITFSERGFIVMAHVGKILPWWKMNRNSGILVMAGVGLLQHQIHIKSRSNQTPLLYEEYIKGFDRLTNGLTISEFIGYHYLSNNRIANFYIGLECFQGFTQNRRSFNYDQMKKDDTLRLDILYGLRLGWILPLYKRLPKEIYYY